jgi:hypothetical protein
VSKRWSEKQESKQVSHEASEQESKLVNGWKVGTQASKQASE